MTLECSKKKYLKLSSAQVINEVNIRSVSIQHFPNVTKKI